MKDYHINVFFSEEDEGYIADIPDLTGRAIAVRSTSFRASSPPRVCGQA